MKIIPGVGLIAAAGARLLVNRSQYAKTLATSVTGWRSAGSFAVPAGHRRQMTRPEHHPAAHDHPSPTSWGRISVIIQDTMPATVLAVGRLMAGTAGESRRSAHLFDLHSGGSHPEFLHA